MVREAKRNNPAYRPHALRALGDFAEIQDDVDLMPDVLSIVPSVVEEHSGDKMEIDSGDLGYVYSSSSFFSPWSHRINPGVLP